MIITGERRQGGRLSRKSLMLYPPSAANDVEFNTLTVVSQVHQPAAIALALIYHFFDAGGK